MKTTMKLTVIALMVMVTMNVFSQTGKTTRNDIYATMMLKGENKVEVRITKPAETVLTLNVYDDSRTRVFTMNIRKETDLLVTHRIDEFPAGVYTYQLKHGKEVVYTSKIVKSTGKALEYAPVDGIVSSGK